MKMTTIAAAGLLMLCGQAAAQALPDSAKALIDSKFGAGQWRFASSACGKSFVDGNFNQDSWGDSVMLVEAGTRGALMAIVSDSTGGYRIGMFESRSVNDLRRQSLSGFQSSRSDANGGNTTVVGGFNVQTCGSKDKQRYVYNKQTLRFDNGGSPGSTSPSAPPSSQSPVATNGGCTIPGDFTLPVGQYETKFEFPFPAGNANARIELTFHVADQNRFYGPLTVYTFNQAAGEQSTVRGVRSIAERVSGGTQFKPVGQWEASAPLANGTGGSKVTLRLGQSHSSVVIPASDRHDRLKVRMRQGTAAIAGATVNAEIRIIGGSCGGTP